LTQADIIENDRMDLQYWQGDNCPSRAAQVLGTQEKRNILMFP